MQNNPGMTFTEIPLNGLRFNFTVTLADNTSLSFPGSYVGVDDPQGYLFKLTIKLDQQDGLIRFYKFISNGVNASYCSIQITASYFGYTQKPGDRHRQFTDQCFLEVIFSRSAPPGELRQLDLFGRDNQSLPLRTKRQIISQTMQCLLQKPFLT